MAVIASELVALTFGCTAIDVHPVLEEEKKPAVIRSANVITFGQQR